MSAAEFARYVESFRRTGFRGGFNWYRCLDRNFALTAPWTGVRIVPPALFLAGARDAFLKAPGLTEKEALADARETLAYLTDLGADEIALSCAFVPPGTPLEARYRAGEFRPPWLSTVLQVIEDARQNRWPLTVGGFDDNPPPVAISSNCGVCDRASLDRIDGFRRTGKLTGVDRGCACRDRWRKLLA